MQLSLSGPPGSPEIVPIIALAYSMGATVISTANDSFTCTIDGVTKSSSEAITFLLGEASKAEVSIVRISYFINNKII